MIYRTEHPKPQFEREAWENLNGEWQFEIDRGNSGAARGLFADTVTLSGKINVPFCPQSSLSGVADRDFMNSVWYRRTFEITDEQLKGIVRLHFGAVDYKATVYVNGRECCRHKGGYVSFFTDITEFVKAGTNILTVHAEDDERNRLIPTGKQSEQYDSFGCYYTRTTGIWQTVWLERVPEKYIKEVETLPEPDEEKVRIIVRSGAEYAVKIVLQKPKIHKELKKNVPDDPVEDMTGSRIADPVESTTETTIGTFYGKTNEWLEIPVQDVQMWTCDTPYLYDFTVEMEKDRVAGYFAMRKFTLEKDGQGFVRICLNHQVQYQNGVLDQGYWPDGLYTAPSDEAMIFDLEQMKKCGFNMVRKHLKIEPQRWYYHCDRLGLVVWQDMVNGGGKYKHWFVTYAATLMSWWKIRMRDIYPGLLARKEKEGRLEFVKEMKETVHRLKGHPSIAAWAIFNEGWGQFQTEDMTAILRKEDPDRLIDQASGWFDQGGGDFCSLHNYFFKLKIHPEKERASVLSEFGGYSYRIEGHSACGKLYGYGICRSKKALNRRYRKRMEQVKNLIEEGLCASVYTQWSDIEEEVNGVYTYDRKIRKID